MFRKVLIANRGEIALRIIRACRELGISPVAVYSEADREALHVQLADEAYCIGPPASARSYLNIPNILSAAVLSGVDAIHPGYGYLSERAQFAEICEGHGIKFIGPEPSCIELMGDKAKAKQAMQDAGVPVVPGSPGPVTTEEEALFVANEIGYPVLIKASAGGGGKGMRLARAESELLRAFRMATVEAEAAFGSGEVYLERFIEKPRHIEIQVFGDEFGNIIHLGERECSLQRRHQKVLEESPSPFVDAELRKKMGEVAVRGCKAVGYTNAGTIEFLVDKDRNFYFMEMNTRIQVEHPVTEMVTGMDLVKEQIRIAAGEKLSLSQEELFLRGHAIECRINAEDPMSNFRPSPGMIEVYHPPGGPGVRLDSAAYAGYTVSPYYDPMFAKLIVWGRDREEAIARMKSALGEFFIEGIQTTIPLHLEIMNNPQFLQGDIFTGFLEQLLSERNGKQ